MSGKEKCELLRSIRKEIADRNGIIFEPSECNHKGDCSGTCPLCDSEARYIDAELNRLAHMGINIVVSGICNDVCEAEEKHNEIYDFSDIERELLSVADIPIIDPLDFAFKDVEYLVFVLECLSEATEDYPITEMGNMYFEDDGRSLKILEMTIEEIDGIEELLFDILNDEDEN